MAITRDFKGPRNKGIVLNFLASYFMSLMSKGIVIEKTNKNRASKCQQVFRDIGMLFSSTKRSIVLTVHTKEIIKIFKNGIFRNPNGYKIEKPPESIMVI